MSASLSWLERCPLAIAVIEPGGSVLYWSAGAERVTGWRWHEVVGRRSGPELLKKPSVAFGLLRQMRREGRIDGRIVTLQGPGGRQHTLSLSVAPLLTRTSEVAAYVAFAVEVSVDSLAPSTIVATGEGVSVVEQLHQGILIEDAAGYITYANQAASRLFDRPLRTMLGQHWTALVPPAEQRAVSRELRSRRQGAARVYETRIQRQNGGDVPVLVNARPQHKEGRFAGVLSEFTDLGQLRTLERRLRRAESAGTSAIMLQALAHDLSNLLAIVLPQAEMLAEKAKEVGETSLVEQAGMIQAALEKGSTLVHQLADFRSEPGDEPVALDLVEELSSIQPLLERIAGPGVGFRMDLPEGVALYSRIHAIEVHQIVFNLVGNARDAVGHQGTIEVSLARGTDAEVGSATFMVVQDDGEGIDPDLLPRIFEPFVTSKDPGKGSGLGLLMVRKLVQGCGGSINVRSTQGKGARFEIVLPECPPPRGFPEVDDKEELSVDHSWRVLVVEDEKALGETLCQALEHLGHQAELAGTAAGAIETIEQAEKPFDIVILDLGLPDMNGRDLRRRLGEKYPNTRAVLCSGSPRCQGDGPAFLRKPFTLDELSRMLRQVLAEPQKVNS